MVMGQPLPEHGVHQGGQCKRQQKAQRVHGTGADGIRKHFDHKIQFLFHSILPMVRVYHAEQ